MQERAPKLSLISSVRIPVAVKSTEACSRHGLVYRRVVLHPWVARRDGTGISRQGIDETCLGEACMQRATAVVNQSDDGVDTKLAQPAESLVGPRPARVFYAIRGGSLPQDRIAQFTNAKCGEFLEILDSVEVSAASQLTEVAVIDAVERAFHATPQFE